MRRRSPETFVDATTLPLEEWLGYLTVPENKRPWIETYRFPTQHHFDQYITSISSRSDKDIRVLLRHFLIEGGSLGVDSMYMKDYLLQPDLLELRENVEFVRRIFNRKTHTWEGMSWILDLLPSHPQEAISAIEAYDLAHYFRLPDGRINGLADAIAIIRARYLDQIHEFDLVASVLPRDFEFLIAGIYIAKGCGVSITNQTRDGGYDLLVVKDMPGFVERLLVECKCQRAPVGVRIARGLLGVLDEQRATRGVLITTSKFTEPATTFARKMARLELLDGKQLYREMNSTFGTNWNLYVSRLITSAKAKCTPSIQTTP